MSTVAQAYEICREIAKREAKNFYWAFRVLPRHKSDAMCAVYAFMRKADDLSDDESMSLEARREAMAAWTAAWRASRNDPAGDAVFLALNDTQKRFGISDELLEQLVAGTTLDLQPQPEGVTMMQVGERSLQVYGDFAALEHYCYLVASVVGLVCIKIFGYTDDRAEQLAVDTGIAFQLTNILRDVKEDAERGRIYLSLDLLKEYDVTPERLLQLCEGLAPCDVDLALLQRVQQYADNKYKSGEALIPLLDKDSRPAMRVLMTIYHRLLYRIAADPAAVFRTRLSVPTSEKMSILLSGAAASLKARIFG